MGIFGGIKKAVGGDFGSKLLAAGAIVNGDYGTAGQIYDYRRRAQGDAAEQQAKAQQAEAAVAALVRQGIPEPDARALVASGAADTVLAQRYGQQADSEFTRTLRAAGIDPASPEAQQLYRQRATTMASPAPQMIGSPETGYRWVQPPAQGAAPQQQGPAEGATATNPQTGERIIYRNGQWVPMGGAGSNAGATFPGFQSVPGGQLRFP